MRIAKIALTLAAGMFMAAGTLAQSYPTKPVGATA